MRSVRRRAFYFADCLHKDKFRTEKTVKKFSLKPPWCKGIIKQKHTLKKIQKKLDISLMNEYNKQVD